MKKTLKTFSIAALAALIVFLMPSCRQDLYNDTTGNSIIDNSSSTSPYLGDLLTVNAEQVWTRSKTATKISQVYDAYKGSNDTVKMYVVKLDFDSNNPTIPVYTKVPVGDGDIANGKLTLTFNHAIDEVNLWEWPYYMYLFPEVNSFVYYNSQVNTSDPTRITNWINDIPNSSYMATINMVFFDVYSGNTYEGVMDRQRTYGTATTVTNEKLIYVYAKADANGECRINLPAVSGYLDGQYFFDSEGPLDLSLKEGLNMVIRRETYGKDFGGKAKIQYEVRNPLRGLEDFKWNFEMGASINGIDYEEP